MASGVCHSDWHVVKGEWTDAPKPLVLGHEGAGIVQQIGPGVKKVKPGDHVILSWMPSCGLCEACQIGRPSVCYNFAEHVQRTALVTRTNENIPFIDTLLWV